MRAALLRRAGALMLSLGLAGAAWAQSFEGGDAPTSPSRPTNPGEAPAPIKAIAGWLDGVMGSDAPLIQGIKPGPYTLSNEAMGEQRDLAEMQISRGVVPLDSFNDYASGVLDRLKAASGQTGIPGRVYVVASGALDAGATADGNVFLSVAYLRSLKNEDQLAALLAHELAHVLLRHHDSNAFTRLQKQFASWLSLGMSTRNALDSALAGRGVRAALSPQQNKALGQLEVMIKFSDVALNPAWTRSQEREADRLGMDLLMKAGYSRSAGLLPWLEMVAQWDELRQQRLAEQHAAKQAALQNLFAAGQLDQGFKQSLELGVGQIIGGLSQTHDDGKQRLAASDDYLQKAYKGEVPRPLPRVQPFEAVVKRPAVQALTQGYVQLFEARDKLAREDPAAAARQLAPLLARGSALANHALPNVLMYQALKAVGKAREAESYLLRATRATPSWWEVHETQALVEKDRGQRERARQIGQSAFEAFSRAPSAYPRLVALYRRSGLTEDMQRVLADCKLRQAEMRERCDEAARGT